MPEPAPHRPPNDSVRVALQGKTSTATWANIFWLNVAFPGTATGTALLALSNAVAAAFRTRFGPQLSPSWTAQTQHAVWYRSSTLEISVDGADTGSGTAAGALYPANVSYLINWAIAGSYRGGHPRTYVSGANVATGDDGVSIGSARRTALTTAAGNFLTDVNALTPTGFTSVTLGTVAFFRNLSALNPPVFEPYLAGSCNPKFASQRRRTRR